MPGNLCSGDKVVISMVSVLPWPSAPSAEDARVVEVSGTHVSYVSREPIMLRRRTRHKGAARFDFYRQWFKR